MILILLQICGNPGWKRYTSKADPKYLLPGCEFQPSNKLYLCTEEKITYNFQFPDTRMTIFFLRQIYQQDNSLIKDLALMR